MDGGGRPGISYYVIKSAWGLSGKVTFEQKPERSKGMNDGDTGGGGGEKFSDKRKSRYKSPELGIGFANSRNTANARDAEMEQQRERSRRRHRRGWVASGNCCRAVYSGRYAVRRKRCSFEEYWTF